MDDPSGGRTRPAPPGAAPRVLAVLRALCLIGFPAIPMGIYLSRVHPGLPGPSAADQIIQLAGSAARWTQVHLAFAVAGLLGLSTILILRREVSAAAPELLTTVVAAIGVVGAAVFTGTVLMEVQVVPELARACSASAACVGPDNAGFARALADNGWRVLPGLGLGGRGLMLGVGFLGILGYVYGSLRTWEAGGLFLGAVLEYANNTGLHAWGDFRPARGAPGLAAVVLLAALASVAYRLLTGRGATSGGEPSEVQAEAAAGHTAEPVAPAGAAADPPSD